MVTSLAQEHCAARRNHYVLGTEGIKCRSMPPKPVLEMGHRRRQTRSAEEWKSTSFKPYEAGVSPQTVGLGHASLSSTPPSLSLEAQTDMKNLLLSLKDKIRGKFEISELNQEKIKEICEIMENKIGILMERMGKMKIALEELDKRVDKRYSN
ncbi:UPF0134 protein MPN_524-like [Pleurodeles waltl]|uniref:UPF0134 protein MPN_524-like n=1 Tax=Pleurodeles waltl TaxID=8319 RepID=UPI0037095201